jgi:hypothetical protein
LFVCLFVCLFLWRGQAFKRRESNFGPTHLLIYLSIHVRTYVRTYLPATVAVEDPAKDVAAHQLPDLVPVLFIYIYIYRGGWVVGVRRGWPALCLCLCLRGACFINHQRLTSPHPQKNTNKYV